MSKDVRCRILRLQPRKFVIISESLAANLEKVCMTNSCKVMIVFLFVPQRLTLVSNAKEKISKLKKSKSMKSEL